MKKIPEILVPLLVLLLLFSLAGCGSANEADASGKTNAQDTTELPASSSASEASEEAECPHQWEAATCTAPATCSLCGATEGEPDPDAHVWTEATCTTPATCSLCGATEGEPLGHSNVDGRCERCGITMATPIAPQETVTIDNVCEFFVDRSQIAVRIDPPTPASYYSYYENKEPGHTYVDVCVAYKNLSSSARQADEALSASLLYGGKYQYSGFSIIEEDNRGDFTYSNITSIAPLTTGYIHYLFDVPDEVTQTNKSIEVTISISGSDYVYTVQAGDGQPFGADDTTVSKTSGEVADGETVTIGGVAEFHVDRSQIAARIDPPSPVSYYSYYEIPDPSQVYVDVCFAVRNLKPTAVRADQVLNATLTYAGSYSFTGFSIIEEENRGDFTYSNITTIAPLTTGYIHYLFAVPAEAQSSGESIVVTFQLGDYTYDYTVV